MWMPAGLAKPCICIRIDILKWCKLLKDFISLIVANGDLFLDRPENCRIAGLKHLTGLSDPGS